MKHNFNYLIILILFLFACGTSDGNDPSCVVTNCHGTHVACGFGEPPICTEEYALGDLCRPYVSCEVKEESCSAIENAKYKTCVDCIKTCEGLEAVDVFSCDSNCRASLETI